MSGFEFEIMDGRDQIETQGKAFAAISITLTQDAKDLQAANDILDQNTLMRQPAVTCLLVFRQRMEFGFFHRRLGILVPVLQALVASIRQTTNL